jgi:hypothetical protein
VLSDIEEFVPTIKTTCPPHMQAGLFHFYKHHPEAFMQNAQDAADTILNFQN